MHTATPTALNSRAELILVFQAIMSSPEACKQALASPSSVFIAYGLNVPDPAAVDAGFYDLVPQIKEHFTSGAEGGAPTHSPLLGCESPGCIACISGMGITLAAVIPVAIAGGAAAAGATVTIAAATGLAAEVVETIIMTATSGSVSQCIQDLCSAMGAC